MDQARGAGYLTDVRYPAHFHAEQAPLWLAAVLAALGRVPPAATSWCEVGCGQGFGALVLAAANPSVRFTGIDINPEHIEIARRRAEAAGLENVRFLCADVRDPDAVEGSFSHIVTHGVLSWVGDDVREAFVAFTARHLAPGGIAAVQYMSEPGGSAFRAFHSVFRQLAGRPDAVAEGLRLLTAMRDAGAGFFQLYPHAGASLDDLLTRDADYIAHEYMNPDFRPLAFREVQGAFAQAGLDWLGSAMPVENVDALSLPTEAARVIEDIRDPVLRETMKDMARNQAMRYDLFAHPAPAPGNAAHMALLRQPVWGLLPGAPFLGPEAETIVFDTRIGPVEGDARVFRPLLQRLGQGPARFADLEQVPPFAGRPGLLNQVFQMALGARFAHPVQPVRDPFGAGRLNRLLLQEAQAGAHVPALSAPALGSGFEVSAGDLAALSAGGGAPHLRLMFVLDA